MLPRCTRRRRSRAAPRKHRPRPRNSSSMKWLYGPPKAGVSRQSCLWLRNKFHFFVDFVRGRQDMKAAVYYSNGGPEVFRFEEIADPACGPKQVLIRVEAISIEGGDLVNREMR